jgi:Fuc2NAc and GlcNAc transferase
MIPLCGFVAGLAGAWFMAHHGFKLSLVDYPNERSSHHSPVPKGGGIGILLAFLVAGWMVHAPANLMIPAAALSLVGFLGDKTHISPKIRLVVQFAASLISMSGIGLPWWTVAPAAVFVVGTANFFNFMDGINGIAGITGVVGFGLIGAFACGRAPGDPLGILALALAAACAGFLPFNLPDARVFMGDVGSILLGYVFACMAVRLSTGPADFFCLCAFLSMFYADELSTMCFRLKSGENLLLAHRRHTYQLLANEDGIAHWKISAGYGLIQLGVGACAWKALRYGPYSLVVLLGMGFLFFCGFTFNLRRRLGDKATAYAP